MQHVQPDVTCLPQVLFAVFDSVQGFVIITVHCAMRREVSPGSLSAEQLCDSSLELRSCISNPAAHSDLGEPCCIPQVAFMLANVTIFIPGQFEVTAEHRRIRHEKD